MSDAEDTEEHLTLQAERERREQELAKEAELQDVERVHERRAERAAYLREKLEEQRDSID